MAKTHGQTLRTFSLQLSKEVRKQLLNWPSPCRQAQPRLTTEGKARRGPQRAATSFLWPLEAPKLEPVTMETNDRLQRLGGQLRGE